MRAKDGRLTAKKKGLRVRQHQEARIETPMPKEISVDQHTTTKVKTTEVAHLTPASAFESLSFEGSTIRTLVQDGEPWFAGTDICRALGIVHTPRAMSSLDADEKMTVRLAHSHCAKQRGGARSLTYINEPGVYRLTMRSDKPKAKAFTRWLAHEVLPAIRKYGHYMAPGSNAAEAAAGVWDTTIGTDGAHVLSDLITKRLRASGMVRDHAARMRMWKYLHAAFNVSRSELIPADKMDAARNLLTAYVFEGTAEAAPEMKPVVYTKPHQYDQPEGVGVPRTRKAMVRIARELMKWGIDNLPEGKVADTFHAAIQDLLALEMTCWTDIDETLVRLMRARQEIEIGSSYLHRWQDRGGRIGNVGP